MFSQQQGRHNVKTEDRQTERETGRQREVETGQGETQRQDRTKRRDTEMDNRQSWIYRYSEVKILHYSETHRQGHARHLPRLTAHTETVLGLGLSIWSNMMQLNEL